MTYLLKIVLLLFLVMVISGSVDQRSRETVSWKTFLHPTSGFSFRYPPGLEIVTEDPAPLHIEGLTAALNVVTGADHRNVLRVLVSEPDGNRLAVNYDRPFLRKVCTPYSEIKLQDGRNAVNCVSCSRGGCAWTIHLLGRRQFMILTMLADERRKAGPEDGEFPLLTMVRSFHLAGPSTGTGR